ncbi:hypothetical protein BDR06DRAFT_975924 [Suillus hirtellus]|nr:hypothetical protein BDR06DRAFT_975924 [Suillus hirtellus]
MVEAIIPCISSDLLLEVQLDFELPAYTACTTALIGSGLTAEAALAQLVDSWTQEWQECIILWQQQLDEDAHALQEAADCEHECEERETAEAEEHREMEKKKPKINNFNVDLLVSDIIIPHPSQFVLQKVKNMKFVELWYFSPDSCEVRDWNKSSADDALGLKKIDGIVALKSFSSFKASNKALQDHDLSWR